MKIDFPVTRTKILIPRRRPELVIRQRLLDTLYELLDYKLLLVAAPAGYGKTSLLIDFIDKSELPFCWYSLDPLDRDPQRFIAHFISAINVRFPKFGDTPAQLLNNSNQERINIDSLVTAIINDLYEHVREHFVIILDDYHLVRESKQVDQFISRFIQDADENMHVVIASRTLMTLPDLPLMVARSQVGGLSFEELAFTPNEIQRFMAQNHNQNITDQAAEELAAQSEGWITGLMMSTQMMGREAASRLRVARVSGIGLYEYLAQQVLEQQPADLQDFLLRSSLLEEFNAEFCEQVIGRALQLEGVDWDELIDNLFRNNLFILPVGEEQVWMRYHHLFRDFLREKMQRDRPDESARIQLALAAVYAAREEWEQAFAIYQRLGRVADLADLAEQAGPSLIIRGRLVTLSEWLNQIPVEARDARPALLSLTGTVNVMRGDTRMGLALLDRAIAGLRAEGIKAQLALALTRRSASFRILGNYQDSQADGEEAAQLCRGDSSMAAIEAEAVRAVGMAHREQGNLIQALTWLKRALDGFEALKDEQNAARVSLDIGRVNEALGRYLDSEKAYYRALEIWQASGNAIWQANLLNNLGVLQHLLGEYETAASTLEKAVQLSREGGYPRMEAFSLTSIGDLYRDLEAVGEALDAYRWARLISRQTNERFLLLYLDLAEAGMARLQGQFFQAGELLTSAAQLAEESQSDYEKQLCRLESGCLKVSRKEYNNAIVELEEAARYFGGEGFRVEAIRTRLYLVIAHSLAGDGARAREHFTRLLALVSGPEGRHPLVTSGREVYLLLQTMNNRAELGTGLEEFLEEIGQFEERIPYIRRNLRRRAMAVPFAPPRMVIRALGKMQVRVNDHLVTGAEWQTQSCRDLFFLVLAHPEGLTKEAIGMIFWPDASPAELKLRFKNNVYRVRHAVGKDSIYLQDDYYYFNRNMDYEFDVESFQREITQAEEVEENDRQLDHYLAALKQYKGAYLPDIEETWVVAERERLYQVYTDTLLKVADLYLTIRQFDQALSYCQRALKEDPCLEAAHRIAMRIHAEMGSRAALVRQYDECRKALLEEFDAIPSAQTQELFDLLMRHN